MARKSTATGARAVFQCKAQNLKEMRVAFHEIAKAVDMSERGRLAAVSGGIQKAYAAAAVYVRDKARRNAQAGGAPKRLHSGARPAIFAFTDYDATRDTKRSRSALVGVRTGLSAKTPDQKLYITWGHGVKRKKGGSVAHGGLSMSLARVFESGTSRGIKARRYFRNAVFGSRGQVLSFLTKAYEAAIRQINGIKLA